MSDAWVDTERKDDMVRRAGKLKFAPEGCKRQEEIKDRVEDDNPRRANCDRLIPVRNDADVEPTGDARQRNAEVLQTKK
jgi:hypothetical protein